MAFTREPSPLMTPAEVAHLWKLTPRTVIARTKPGSRKRNRVEPCFLTPDLRWKREQVYADYDAATYSLERVVMAPSLRARRIA